MEMSRWILIIAVRGKLDALLLFNQKMEINLEPTEANPSTEEP